MSDELVVLGNDTLVDERVVSGEVVLELGVEDGDDGLAVEAQYVHHVPFAQLQG